MTRHTFSFFVGTFTLLAIVTPARAQNNTGTEQQQPPASSAASAPATGSSTAAPSTPVPASTDPSQPNADRIFGVLPNYTTIEGGQTQQQVAPVTAGQSFKMAALDSFDPFVYPMFGFVAMVNHVENQEPTWGRGASGYGKRYGAAFADNTVCSLITTGLMPSIFKQDPRYFQLGTGNFVYRLGYSASRSIVTHSRTGKKQFNISEIGGTLVVATISNAYYPPSDRTASDTLVRWGMQAMWDTVANELKE